MLVRVIFEAPETTWAAGQELYLLAGLLSGLIFI